MASATAFALGQIASSKSLRLLFAVPHWYQSIEPAEADLGMHFPDDLDLSCQNSAMEQIVDFSNFGCNGKGQYTQALAGGLFGQIVGLSVVGASQYLTRRSREHA